MKLSFDSGEFLKEWLKAFPGCIHLKVQPGVVLENGVEFGVLLRPSIVMGQVGSDEEMWFAVKMLNPMKTEVVVIGQGMGHGYGHKFVWRGTPAEFIETWRGD